MTSLVVVVKNPPALMVSRFRSAIYSERKALIKLSMRELLRVAILRGAEQSIACTVKNILFRFFVENAGLEQADIAVQTALSVQVSGVKTPVCRE